MTPNFDADFESVRIGSRFQFIIYLSQCRKCFGYSKLGEAIAQVRAISEQRAERPCGNKCRRAPIANCLFIVRPSVNYGSKIGLIEVDQWTVQKYTFLNGRYRRIESYINNNRIARLNQEFLNGFCTEMLG